MIYLITGLTLRVIPKEEVAAEDKAAKSNVENQGSVPNRFPPFRWLAEQRVRNHQAWYGETDFDDFEIHERLT